jgi:hypothetical protein
VERFTDLVNTLYFKQSILSICAVNKLETKTCWFPLSKKCKTAVHGGSLLRQRAEPPKIFVLTGFSTIQPDPTTILTLLTYSWLHLCIMSDTSDISVSYAKILTRPQLISFITLVITDNLPIYRLNRLPDE